jgi:hypothetical protein
MKQLIYKDRIYICGNVQSVIKQLKSLTGEYKTVRELLESKRQAL